MAIFTAEFMRTSTKRPIAISAFVRRASCYNSAMSSKTVPPIAPEPDSPTLPCPLNRTVNGRPAVFLDGPGGTQSPQAVIDAMTDYLQQGSSNLGGPFLTSREADDVVDRCAPRPWPILLNARPEEIVFGQNMTSLTFSISRAISRTWQAGDEIVVTKIDHDANISPWLTAAADRGVTVRWLDFHPENCTLAVESLAILLNERTRLVAVNYASNAVGTINDVRTIIAGSPPGRSAGLCGCRPLCSPRSDRRPGT